MPTLNETPSITDKVYAVRSRRAWALVLFGLLIPGSAQAVHGRGKNRRLGRNALKLWIILFLLSIAAVTCFLVIRNQAVGFFTNGLVLKVLGALFISLAAFWGVLAVDTIIMARPRGFGGARAVVFTLVSLVLTLALIGATAWLGRAAWVAGGSLSQIFVGGGNTTQNHGRYNILLLGADSGADRWGLRPDSITVASVSADTGRTVLFSLPRNMQNVPFPETSPMHSLYPTGYLCPKDECLLNAVYLLGTEHADMYPGVDDPGVQATIDAVTGATGLEINYYAMIDMQGFIDLIDAMGGITLNVHQRIPIDEATGWWIEIGDNQHLDGFHALWFARARHGTSDYDRMARQKCVMSAMLHQLDAATVATHFVELASASGKSMKTSVPSSQISTLTSLAMKARSLPITSVSFTPPLINPAIPDFSFIHSTVFDTIAQSEALDAPSQPTDETSSEPPPEAPVGSPTQSAGETNDLEQVCSVA